MAQGLEALGAEELTAAGATEIQPAFRGLHFRADLQALYQAVYTVRIVTRVLAPLCHFRCPDAETLYRHAVEIPWIGFFSPEETFAIFATVSGNPRIRHSQFAAQRLKDAVADYFRRTTGQRPDVERHEPHAWINLHIEGERATISFDLSGGSLHRRGYRIASVEAPLQENIAAALIRLSGWSGSRPLYDPMCGCGTLLCEALMHYGRIPAGFLRSRFGFELLPDFNPAIWQAVKTRLIAERRPLPNGLIAGSDLDSAAVDAASANLQRLPGGGRVPLTVADFRNLSELRDTLIVCNPPYGIRLGTPEEIALLYRDLGDFLKKRCTGSTAFIFCGNRELIPHIGLKPALKIPVGSGGLDGRVVKYEIR